MRDLEFSGAGESEYGGGGGSSLQSSPPVRVFWDESCVLCTVRLCFRLLHNTAQESSARAHTHTLRWAAEQKGSADSRKVTCGVSQKRRKVTADTKLNRAQRTRVCEATLKLEELEA